jgi:hypothetical protein
VDNVVVGFDQTTILFAEDNIATTKAVAGDLVWTSGIM